MTKCQRRSWVERRGEGWSTTRYEGLFFWMFQHGFLVTKLSHGLRAIKIKNPADYQFDESLHGELMVVEDEFLRAALRMLNEDESFQKLASEYERVMRNGSG